MPKARFKKLFPKLELVERKKPRSIDGRIARLEEEIADMRGVLRELIETLERELMTDLDQDARIGRVSAGRGLPKTARLAPFAPPRSTRVERRPRPLPPNIP